MSVLRFSLVCLLTSSCHYANFQDRAGPGFPFELLSWTVDSEATVVVPSAQRVATLPTLPPLRERGLASGYAAWKPEWIRLGRKRLKVSNGKPYCWYFKKVKRGDPIIAHRRLPCGTRVYVKVVGSQRGAWVRVGDRGPYGACVRMADLQKLQRRLGRKLTTWKNEWCLRHGKDWIWYIKRHSSWPGKYRGIADISHVARKIIGHNGWQHVTLRYWYPDADPHNVAQAEAPDPGLALSDAFDATRDRWSQR